MKEESTIKTELKEEVTRIASLLSQKDLELKEDDLLSLFLFSIIEEEQVS